MKQVTQRCNNMALCPLPVSLLYLNQEQALTKSKDAADRALCQRELHVEQLERTLADSKAQQAARAARLDELTAALETRSRALRTKGAAVAEAQQQHAAVRWCNLLCTLIMQ